MVRSQVGLKVKRLKETAQLPELATAGAACIDIRADIENGSVIINPGDSAILSTGLAVEIPEGFVMLIFSRSGHGFKNGIRLANSVGVIDSDYRGELMVKLVNDGSQSYQVHDKERVCQAMIIPSLAIDLEEVDQLSTTDRNVGGFGSTGTL